MNLVSDLDLPVFDYSAPDFSADRYHHQLAETSHQGWLAKSPLAELEEAVAFLAPRTPNLALDGPAQLGGVEGIYGIDKLPITWSGPALASPGPDVT
jgi:hypothetical protein